MTAKEKNAYELKLVQLKSKFIEIGVLKMPSKTISELMPKSVKRNDIIAWNRVASNVWNGRSTEYVKYLPIFKKAYNLLKDNETIVT